MRPFLPISTYQPELAPTSRPTTAMLRATRPKLSLSVPTGNSPPTAPSLTLNVAALTPRSPRSPLPPSSASSSYTPLTLAARNAVLNQRGFSTLQIPTFAYVNAAASKSILKRDPAGTVSHHHQQQQQQQHFQSQQQQEEGRGISVKSISFSDESPTVQCITPLPLDCYGTYARMSKEERRWRRE